MSDAKMQILRMIEDKEITTEEGIKLLEALSAGETGSVKEVSVGEEEEATTEAQPEEIKAPESENLVPEEPEPSPVVPPDLANMRHLWLIPLVMGGMLGAIGLAIIILIQTTSQGSFFLVCGWLPVLLGLMIVFLAVWSRNARWLHIRIRGEQRITLSFPLPLRLTGWIMRLVRPYVPQLEETGLDEIILSLDEGLGNEGGFYVDVQDDEDGEQVQVYIG